MVFEARNCGRHPFCILVDNQLVVFNIVPMLWRRKPHETGIKQGIRVAHQSIGTGHRTDDLSPPLSTTPAARLRLCDLGAILLGISRGNVAHIPILLHCNYVHHTIVWNCRAGCRANRSRVEDLALVDNRTYRVNRKPAGIST